MSVSNDEMILLIQLEDEFDTRVLNFASDIYIV